MLPNLEKPVRIHSVFIQYLTLSQMTNFRLFQSERLCRRQSDENGRKFYKRVGNTVGKGEIARYGQFLLFLRCLQKSCTADTKHQGLLGKGSTLLYQFCLISPPPPPQH